MKKKPNSGQFQKGNPGRPKGNQIVNQLKKITLEDYLERINRIMSLKPDELKFIKQDPSFDVLDAAICSVVSKAIEFGDDKRLEALMRRLVGPVKEQMELTNKNEPILIEYPDGKKIAMGTVEEIENIKDAEIIEDK